MRKLQGTIVSDKMRKTRVVSIDRLVKHPRYEKRYNVTQRFKAHDEKEEYKTGDIVVIKETRPMSKEKRWEIIKLVKRVEIKAEKDKE